jgi:hypothetical protein
LAAGPFDVTKVRDALCSGIVAASQGDWTALTGIDPGSAVRSVIRRMWPRVSGFVFFSGLTVVLLWASTDESWRNLALAAAIPLGLSAVFSLVSPSNDATKRAQEVFDKAFSPLRDP